MPDLTTLIIAGGAWTLLFAFVWAMFAAAGRSDRVHVEQPVKEPRDASGRTPVVADTGGIRAQLRAAAGLIEAEQLTVTVAIDGTDAVLASSRAVIEAQAGDWPQIAAPVRIGTRTIATLRAFRRPGDAPFDSSDGLLLRAIAVRISGSMEVATPVSAVPVGHTDAMA